MDGVIEADGQEAAGANPAPPMLLATPRIAAAPPAAGEYWDFGHAGDGAEHVSLGHEFTELARLEAKSKRTKLVASVLLLVLALGAGYGAYELFFNNHNLLDDLVALFTEEPAGEAPVPAAARPKTDLVKQSVKPPRYLQAVPGNPYWALPNRLFASEAPRVRSWTPEEEQAYRVSLEHRFPYQRFKVITDIRRQRLSGSESLLWQGLQDKKFWTRMQAAVGLAEFNIEVPVKTLETALTQARSELIANFFERFVHKPNAGQLYLMRQAIRLVDERGRLVLLRALTHSKDPLRDVYMVAASLDPGQHIKAWWPKAMAERGVNHRRFAELLAVVKGDAPPDLIFPGAGKTPKTAAPTASKVAGVLSDEEMETELESADKDGGSVQFFPEKSTEPEVVAKPISDAPAAETFEYDK